MNKFIDKIGIKKFILTIITFILIVIVFFLIYLLFNQYILKKNLENEIIPFANKNENTIFEINKVIFFSSGDAKNKTSSVNHFTVQNLYQYTDIALFISSPNIDKTSENTLKNLKIENIQFTNSPILGEPKLYFKSINDFAKSDIIEENLINDTLNFEISSSDHTVLDSPILYNNLANPITLSFINNNIKSDYTITDTSAPITYDGSLLNRCNVSLESLACDISFDIIITNNIDQEFKTTIYIDIPLEFNDKSIFDGNITLKNNTNYKFLRYK